MELYFFKSLTSYKSSNHLPHVVSILNSLCEEENVLGIRVRVSRSSILFINFRDFENVVITPIDHVFVRHVPVKTLLDIVSHLVTEGHLGHNGTIVVDVVHHFLLFRFFGSDLAFFSIKSRLFSASLLLKLRFALRFLEASLAFCFSIISC